MGGPDQKGVAGERCKKRANSTAFCIAECKRSSLQKDDFANDLLANLGIDELCHAGFSHQQLVLKRGRSEAHEKPTLINVDLLGFQGDGLTHYPLPTRYHGYFVELALKTVCPNQRFESFLKWNNIAGAGRGGGLFQGVGRPEWKRKMALVPGVQRYSLPFLNWCYSAILHPKPEDGNSDAGQCLVSALQVSVGKKNLAEGLVGD